MTCKVPLLGVPRFELSNQRHLDRHLDGSLKVRKYHGQNRDKIVDKLDDADLVLTTYNTIAMEFSKKRSKLHALAWYRVVLDEDKYLAPYMPPELHKLTSRYPISSGEHRRSSTKPA